MKTIKLFNKFVSKNASQSKIKTKNVVNSSTDYKPFFFTYRNIEYKSKIPSLMNQNIRDFLKKFAEEKGENLSYKDFEIVKDYKYLGMEEKVSALDTRPGSKSPIQIYDSTLTYENIKYRGLNHILNPYTSSSQTLQGYLNSYLNSIDIKLEKVNKQDMTSNLKSLGTLDKLKSDLMAMTILNQLPNAIEGVKIEFKINSLLDLMHEEKPDKRGVLIMRNLSNDVMVPINVVIPAKSEEEREARFNTAIIDNMDNLRKLSAKNKTSLNFGIVTDLSNWKINLYHKPTDKNFEKPSDFLTSLKYSLTFTTSEISSSHLSILFRVIGGLLQTDQKTIRSV